MDSYSDYNNSFIDKILATLKGQRPEDQSTYLRKDYIEQQLNQFDNGHFSADGGLVR